METQCPVIVWKDLETAILENQMKLLPRSRRRTRRRRKRRRKLKSRSRRQKFSNVPLCNAFIVSRTKLTLTYEAPPKERRFG